MPSRMLLEEPPNRCQAPGSAPGQMLANRRPKPVPGTRGDARSDTSKQTGRQIGARSVPVTRHGARSDASKQGAKSVPGTRCGARSDASMPKSVPGTKCLARSDASKIGAAKPVPGIGAAKPVPGTRGDARSYTSKRTGRQIGASH